MTRLLLSLAFVTGMSSTTPAQEPKPPAAPPPTAANVAYGTHERQVLDFWKADSDKPTPLVFAIHGGGWVAGDKSSYRGIVSACLKAGVSVVSINYRYVTQAVEKGVEPPVKWPIEDAVRALQFVRTKAKAWNIDKERIGATGGSAGGCSSLYLAMHDDLADPKSTDPVARESTRLFCAAVVGPQTSLDPKPLREWMPNARYGGHAFGFRTKENRDGAFQAFHENREKVLPWIKQYSPIEFASKDDPPIFMDFPSQKKPPVKGEPQGDPTHSAILGLMLKEKLDPLKVECIVAYPGQPHAKYKTAAEFLIDRLKK